MTQYLPPNLLALFAPRDPVRYIPPVEKPHHYRNLPYTGVAQFLNEFEDPVDTPAPRKIETREERRERRRREKAEQAAYKLEQDLAMWDPQNNTNATKDPYKTLFVARINYDTSESKLRREFEVYGPIRDIRMMMDKYTDKPRGYAFIEYEHERDMHAAYKHAEGKKIDGRRVLVDVERARTIKNWRPRRLAGGFGFTRRGPADAGAVGASKADMRVRGGGGDERRRSRSPRGDRRDTRERRQRSRSPRERKPRPKETRERRRSRSRERRHNGADEYGDYGVEIKAELY